MSSPICKVYDGEVMAGKPKTQLARRPNKRLVRDRYLYDPEIPIEPKRKCPGNLAEEVKVPKVCLKSELSNGNGIEVRGADDPTVKYVSYIKLRQTKYKNPIIPVLPMTFAQVKHI